MAAVKREHPAWQEFLTAAGEELLMGQVLFRQTTEPHTFHLRHVADRDAPESDLRSCTTIDLRLLAQADRSGAFRPLRCAPDLVAGWRFDTVSAATLFDALQELYPGAIADWHAFRVDPACVTHYRDYATRQTGMFRITAQLSDADVATVARSCCAPRFCLKRRLWSVEGLPFEEEGEKSIVPCLEPCALLMELARRTVRLLQEEPTRAVLRVTELESLEEALRFTLDHQTTSRHGDFADVTNPRRLQALLLKLSESRMRNEAPPSVHN